MSAVAPTRPRDPRWLGLVAAGLLLALAIIDTPGILRGIFTAFLLLLPVPVGALLLLLVHRLTGGEWGRAMRPALARAAHALPAVALLVLPALLWPSLVFRWAADPASRPSTELARFYLTAPGLALRSLVALALWSGFALLAAARPDRLTKGLASLGLVLFGLTVSLVAVDWVLSLDPRFQSSAFAMSFTVACLLSATGFAMATGRGDLPRDDMAKLAAAFALGLFYLDLMQFLVAYDGNLPDKAAWYLRRAGPLASVTLALAFVGAVLLPFALVLISAWRASPRLQRMVGWAVLVGIALRTLWWTVPEWQGSVAFWLALPLAAIAAAALAALFHERSAFALRAGRVIHGA
ncbi:hypothetical protein GCM10011390_28490 [Aureimonas endophytica]|uniref:Quinol:cytochrome c oxidoreductase quinone-binding subunit 2 n=1 Tax=Aureimonas endophytica TaxID=2027858 RepID=A0A916ZPH8_9HYPH|nr:hypothetical protein [Aureimonas endophytica]GGE07754.1 hypothetical protein GCM10011390_28490 [Aureimonas endophytica]